MSDDYERHVEVVSVQCNRTQDGELQTVKTKVEYFEHSYDEYGEATDFQNGQSIRVRWRNDGTGTMLLDGWKDASDTSGWVSPAVLRCLPASALAVEKVPDVHVVMDEGDELAAELDIGYEAAKGD